MKVLFDKGEEKVLSIIDDIYLLDENANLSGFDTIKEYNTLTSSITELEGEFQNSNGNIPREIDLDKVVWSDLQKCYSDRLERFISDFKDKMAEALRSKELMELKVSSLSEYFGIRMFYTVCINILYIIWINIL